jgi:hypothetical protein
VDVAPRKPPAKPVPAPLIGGKPQGGNIGPGIQRNAAPDARLNMPTPWVGKVERGSIYEHMPSGKGEFHFQYNPNSLSFGFSFNEALADPSTTAQVPTMGALGGTVLGFEILLNRQYEVAYEGSSEGVMNDINALKYIVGMKDPRYNYMLLKTLRFVLGKNIIFYGFINNMNAVVELFSEKMVPMFAKVGISAVQMPHDFDPKGLFGGGAPPAVAPVASGTLSPAYNPNAPASSWTSKPDPRALSGPLAHS